MQNTLAGAITDAKLNDAMTNEDKQNAAIAWDRLLELLVEDTTE